MSNNKIVTYDNLAYYNEHKIKPLEDLALGRSRALVADDYAAAVTAIEAITASSDTKTKLRVGDSVLIKELGVKDMWVTEVLTTAAAPVTATGDALKTLISNALATSQGFACGLYRFSELEVTKVSLTGYATESYVDSKVNPVKAVVDNLVGTPTVSGPGDGYIKGWSVDAQGHVTLTKATIPLATNMLPGLMSGDDKAKVDNLTTAIAAVDGDYMTNVAVSNTGVITLTKSNFTDATTTAHGMMSAADKTKLDGMAYCTDADIQAIING